MFEEKEALARVLGVLDDVCVQIRTLEAEAQTMLEKQEDPKGSADNMRVKAGLLMDLPELMDPFLYGLGDEAKKNLQQGLDTFARGAQAALEQDSVFWMRNLLYPEDYVDGQPNDLERFAADLAPKS